MKIMLLLMICVAILCCGRYTSAQIQEPEARGVGDTSCETLSKGGVICVSKTQFVLKYQDPKIDKPLSCPAGTVCANDASICSASMNPMCTNEIPGAKGVCNICPGGAGYNPICVSSTEFAFCVNNKIITTLKYKCTAPTPYCKATFDSAGGLIGICTADATKTDCSATGGTRSPLKEKEMPSERQNDKKPEVPQAQQQNSEFVCTQDGYFADTSDKFCQSYIKCKKEASGIFSKKNFKCSMPNTVFNALTKKCVLAESYNCSL